MAWQINKKLNAIHILKGEPPCTQWEWQKGRRNWDVATNDDFLDGCVTTLTWHRPKGISQREQEANARLIAAAPDLLAALEQIVDLNLGCASLEEKREADAIFESARQTIDKAKGVE